MDVRRESSQAGRHTPADQQQTGLVSGQLPSGEHRYGRWLGRPVKELPTPPEVLEAFDRELGEMEDQGRPVTGVFKERILEDYKLQYYFGGQPIAYRETESGKTVLAVGYGKIGELRRQLNAEENEAVTTGFAETW